MSTDCLGCVCGSPPSAEPGGRLILATRIDHTARALRSLAARRGVALRQLAPGLLSMDAPGVEEFLGAACDQLTSVEAEEVSCLRTTSVNLPEMALLAEAMTAPSLAAVGARVTHADLQPLFDDEEGCFHSMFQPIVELGGGRTVGFEALLRATTPAGAPVYPDVLFPAAEAAGWTHVLDRVGRTTALRDAGPWLGEELLFINFIPTSIYRPEVCLRTTEAAARRAGVRLDQVVFEVTESHQVRDLGHLEQVFAYYRSHHCKVALDDLGAGYSSLNMLVRLRPDIVKLDKELVQALPDPVSTAVVAAIVSITHSYGGLVLAECVETAEQAEAALGLGVDLGQGWFFGRPERRTRGASSSEVVPLAAAVPGGVDPSPVRSVAAASPPAASPVAASPVGGPRTAGDGAPDVLRRAGISRLLARAVDASVSGVVVVDMLTDDQSMIYVNPAFERMTGYAAAEVVGGNCRFLQGADTDRPAVRALAAAIRHGQEHRAVLRNYRKDGSAWWNELHLSPVRDERSRLTHYLGFQHDVTTRVEAEEQLLRQAAHDSLTGLANRTSLVEQLDAALAAAVAEQRAVAVLFIDLDGFKAVNDDFGHSAGDTVLVQFAERTRATLRAGDLLARTGGDEFVAVLAGLDPIDAARVARRAAEDVVAGLRRPFTAGTGQAVLGGSIGFALFPDHAASGEALLSEADAAMYDAKRAGGGGVRAAAPARWTSTPSPTTHW